MPGAENLQGETMYPYEEVIDHTLAEHGKVKVFRWKDQAYRAANRLTIDGYDTHVVRSYSRNGWLVSVRGK